MANETVTDGGCLNILAEPAFNIASLLHCAWAAVREIEDSCPKELAEEVHAVQRTLLLCQRMAVELGEVGLDYDRCSAERIQAQALHTKITGEASHAH